MHSIASGKEVIYADIDSWRGAPEEVRFFYVAWDFLKDLEGDEIYLGGEGVEMPKSVGNYNLRFWILVNQLERLLKGKVDWNGV
ncbi:hypothetical protein [Burkholderia cepacia]|uniref:hypothetical protein n=1 Tax=Burkholderia cepacia TaxID=292 RepID=UPI001CF562FA|nr:hypothetical protein [Burkholderia cepacia]MCA8111394.1 hypothetical protein [Burkholderia cepacia]MCA8397046.1 hypothetical protein [Burkholderia cepacia]